MTYKKFAEMMVEEAACKWLKEMCGEGWDILNAKTEIEKDKTGDLFYTVEIEIRAAGDWFPGNKKTYIVGGAVGEYTGICNSVIWRPTECGKEIAWMSVKETREELGITEFVA